MPAVENEIKDTLKKKLSLCARLKGSKEIVGVVITDLLVKKSRF